MKNDINIDTLDRPVRKLVEKMQDALMFLSHSDLSPEAKKKILGLVQEIAQTVAQEVRP